MDKIKWIATFAYSGSGRREFFDKDFEVNEGENVDTIISEYVKDQNKGEAKSDRIRFWSKRKNLSPNNTQPH